MTTPINGSSMLSLVEPAAPGEMAGPGPHGRHRGVEEVGHLLERVGREPGEQAAAGTEFHATLRVDGPHLGGTGRDSRAQASQHRPDDRAFAGAGDAGHRDVGAGQTQSPRRAVLGYSDRHGTQARHRDGQGGDHRGEGVAVGQFDGDPARAGHPDSSGAGAEAVGEALDGVLPVGGDLAGQHPYPQPVHPRADVDALEEELLGRQDFEQLSATAGRIAAPRHPLTVSEPMRWLLDHGDAYQIDSTGFGINMLTGTYEFPCLIRINDGYWWPAYGDRVEANWETMRLHCYSSRDADGLTALIADPKWSNEGLFAVLLGLRRLSEVASDRVCLPHIEVVVP
jgi:hypothetical protein